MLTAATVLEGTLVLGAGCDDALDALPARAHVVARAAHRRYGGRGSGHAARRTFGECSSCVLAKVTGEPLLFTDDDFGRTDSRAWT